jgi:hypothetical protein
LEFVCPYCGIDLLNVASILVHCRACSPSITVSSPNTATSIPATPDANHSSTETDASGAVLDNSSSDLDDFYASPDLGDSFDMFPDPLDTASSDDIGGAADGESEEMNDGRDHINVHDLKSPQYECYISYLAECPAFERLLEVYHFCVDAKMTEESYEKMRKTDFFRTHPAASYHLKDIKRKIISVISTRWLPSINNTIAVGDVRIPYCGVFNCLSIWLVLPGFIEAVSHVMRDNLPDNLLDIDEYNRRIDDRDAAIENGTHICKSFTDGVEYLEHFRDAVPLFRDSYTAAKEEGIVSLVCNLGLFEDAYCKSMDSPISQTLFTITLRKLYPVHT